MLAVLMLEALLFKMFKYSTFDNSRKTQNDPAGEEKDV